MPKIPGLKWKIRVAEEKDIPVIMDLCYQLSVYEKLEFKGTPELYKKYGFSEDKIFDCLLAENMGDIGPEYLGVALYYYTFSTFESKPTLWLEDVFVPEEYRGNGVGTQLLKELCKIAVVKDCGRFEWTVLDWNEPSRQFYYGLGATSMDEWTTFRMTPEVFKRLSENEG
ncbi:MAG: GNAT family N-acetyltransferase [Candidatus Bathyarchaeota archaeon]|nr:GNAT family N-acetyltransferase [Candidatus Bathyarchaeota archaeon]